MPVYKTGSFNLNYYEYGTGQELMLAFHGFGMKGTQFRIFEEALGKKYKIISFDLFFHGATGLRDTSIQHIKKGLPAKELAEDIRGFLKIHYPDVNKVALLSYSLGTRVALSLIEHIPESIAAAYLIAPDGIEPNRLLQLGGSNFVINSLFYKLVHSPRTVSALLRLLLKMKYIDEPIFRILKGEFGTTETRMISYNTITYFARSAINRRNIAKAVNRHGIDLHLYFGKHDKLFPASIGRRFSKLLTQPNVHVFDAGHELVNDDMARYLARQLQ